MSSRPKATPSNHQDSEEEVPRGMEGATKGVQCLSSKVLGPRHQQARSQQLIRFEEPSPGLAVPERRVEENFPSSHPAPEPRPQVFCHLHQLSECSHPSLGLNPLSEPQFPLRVPRPLPEMPPHSEYLSSCDPASFWEPPPISHFHSPLGAPHSPLLWRLCSLTPVPWGL